MRPTSQWWVPPWGRRPSRASATRDRSGAAFSIGGGLAAGTIALVSQRFSADEIADAGQALRSSAALTVAATLPIAVLFYSHPAALIGLLTDRQAEIAFGADYLRVVAFGVPFAGLNLIGSRALIGADDAYTAMVLRGGGALANIGLNGVFIFGLGWGVVGAGLGTVLSNVVVTTAFVGLSRPPAGRRRVPHDGLGAGRVLGAR